MWKSKGKTLLDLVERQPDDYFLVYTNGTFIDDETAARMRQLGNVTPAISVEGFEAETDARRGKGVHRQIVKPCVFIPYAAANIYEIYNNGGDINQVFETELFKQLRQFQNDYAYARSNENVDNWLCPCPTRDHHERFQDILQHTQPKPIDESAAIAMQDRNYIEGMTEYGKQLYSISYPTWKARYQQTQAQDHIV